MLHYLIKKLTEPSTSAGLAVMLLTAAPTLTPYAGGLSQLIAGALGVAAVLLNERAK